MRRVLRRLLRRDVRFAPGERVVFEDGTGATVHRSWDRYSHVYWDDDQPTEDFGGSVVPNTKLRRAEEVAMTESVNLAEKLALFDEHWQPKIVARINDCDVRIGKVKGEFVWHKHDHTDDFFLVLAGHLTIQLRDRTVELDEGELFVVPRGVEHCPRADEEASILVIEPSGTVNTGDAGGPRTAEPQPI